MWSAIYPGQGSQHSGMGKFLWDNFQKAKDVFEEASDSVGVNFRRLCFEGAESELALTHNTQPSLLIVSVACYRVLHSLTGVEPVAAAGHSVGEYAALVSAGAVSFSEAVRAVRQRGELMQSAVPVGQGGMVAVMGVTPDQARELCLWVQSKCDSKNLDPANFNCPGQVVISGSKSLIDWLMANYSDEAFAENKPKRIKFIPLNVSAPFHSSLMKPAEARMREVLEKIIFSDSAYPIVQNFSAEATKNGQVLRENLIRQISAPVRWVECVEKLVQMGGRRMIEIGCGKVLAGLVKKIDGNNIESFNINSMIELNALEKVLQS